MVPRIEKIARTSNVMINYLYSRADMQNNGSNKKKKEKPPVFNKVLHTAMDKAQNDAYKVEINARIR
ncbi:hypothetical protein [Pectinatus cerevisiiphilus]|uniref:Uncharacterized protein n=1 Tax=Pectinatus cerevisiiphilus TaxID=86956 RepID=A0A4R3KAU6_9FIRM|nr:hypothetical protein [Pectinatus cerevisiiphilus]TCS80128.1 hypothetical protein EDC37_105200 [Pectinatus cerevisiiphilus]